MLFGVFGVPSPMSYWVFGALRTVVEICFARHSVLAASSLSQVRESLTVSGGDPILFFSDSPDVEMAEAFANAGAPYLMCLDSPLEVLGFCMSEREMDPINGLRLTECCFAALHNLALGSHAKVLRRNPQMRISDYLIEICAAFRLTSDPAIVADAVRRLAGDAGSADPLAEDLIVRSHPHARPLGTYPTQLNAGGAPEWVCQTANQYLPMIEGNAIDSFYWPRQAFIDPGGKDQTVAARQELIGPSRHLVYGPFLHLPKGEWRATVGVEVADAGANSFSVDVAIMGLPVRVARFQLPGMGKFEFTLDFEVIEPKQFVEIRILLLNGAIEGQVGFSGVRIARSPHV